MSDLFAVVGAGPSLDYATGEIERLALNGARFLVSDSVAAAFLRRFPKVKATVFTVELRRHLYLARISGISLCEVMAYQKVNPHNLRFTSPRTVTRFKIRGEDGDCLALYSPGTVLGVMLSYAVHELGAGGEIHIIGADFSYIDQQVYSRFIAPHAPLADRLHTGENWQLEMAWKKTGGVIMKHGFAVRTSFELMQARENMRDFFTKQPAEILCVEYSPIGFDHERIEKRMPVAAT